MKKILFAICALLYCSTSFAQFPWGGPANKVVTDSIYSNVLSTHRAYNVFLPKSFETQKDKKYPILYLLHGMLDTHQGWDGRGHLKDVMDQLLASGEACEMIIVTPNAGGNIFEGVWNGYFNMPGWSYEKFFFEEFMPYIESKYRAIGDKKHRAIAGLSMGGGGATKYALSNPDKFCAVYAMSALMTTENSNPNGDPNSKMQILTKSVIENSCVNFIKNADEKTKSDLRTVKWFVDCGDDDFLFDFNIEFVQAMRKAQIPVELRVRDGGHTWEYWNSALYTCLPYITRCFLF